MFDEKALLDQQDIMNGIIVCVRIMHRVATSLNYSQAQQAQNKTQTKPKQKKRNETKQNKKRNETKQNEKRNPELSEKHTHPL